MQYSLDQLRADVHEKYDFELAIDTGEVVNLRGALRLSEEERDQVEAIGKRFEALDVEAKAIQVAMKAKAGQEVRPSRGAKKPPALRDAKAVEADVMNVVREQIMLLTDDKDLGAKLIEQIGEDKALLLQVFHAYNEKTQAGGSLALARLIDEHGYGVIAYDLARLGIDLRGVIRGEIAPRYALALIANLDSHSATLCALRGEPQARGWSTDTYLTAATVDLLQGANYQRTGGKGRRPKPVPRPTKPKSKKRVVQVADVIAAQRRAAKQKATQAE